VNCLLPWLNPSFFREDAGKTTDFTPSDPKAARNCSQSLNPNDPLGKEQSQDRQSYVAVSGTKKV